MTDRSNFPVVVAPMGFVPENLPMGLQILGRPWSEGQLIKFAYAYEQVSHHRRPPPSAPPLADSLAAKFIGTWKLAAVNATRPPGPKSPPREVRRAASSFTQPTAGSRCRS